MRKKIISRLGAIILLIIMALCTVIIIYTTVRNNKPSVFGYRIFVVRTGSMLPTLEVGDLIITKKVAQEDLEAGTIISFISTDSGIKGNINTHRIAEIKSGLYYTMGDAIGKIDETPVKYSNILGEVVWNSSLAGKIFRWFASPLGMTTLILLPIFFIVFIELKGKKFNLRRFIFKDNGEKEADEDEKDIFQQILDERPDSILPEDLPERVEKASGLHSNISKEAMSEKVGEMISRGIQISKAGAANIEGGAFSKDNSINSGGFQMADVSFNTQIRGYNPKEVDEYIEKIHKEYTEVCAFLQEKIKTLETSLSSQEDVANAMIRAESVARVIEDEGRAKAGNIISEAETKAQSIISLAEVEAGRFVREANESRDKIRNEMQQIFNIASMFLKQFDAFDDNNS